MKNVIATLIIFAIFFIIPGIAGWYETHYTMNAEAVACENGQTMIFVDKTGNTWAYDTTEIKIGDKVKILFDTNYTDETRKDDIIEKITKE